MKKNKNIIAVITKRNSSFNSDFYDLNNICIKKNIKCFYTNDVNNFDTISFIRDNRPDLIYCFGWSQLIKKELLNIPKIATVGFHPAKLPSNRGRHPLIWALVLGLKKTASTFFIMDEGADSGDIISQEDIDIEYEDNARTLYDKVMNIAKRQVIDITNRFETNNLVKIRQSNKKYNVWRKRNKIDGQIDWRMSSCSIYNLVRALYKPYVGAHFVYKGKEYKVWKCRIIDGSKYKNIEYGKVIKNDKGRIIVKTSDDLIQIVEGDKIKVKEGEYLL